MDLLKLDHQLTFWLYRGSQISDSSERVIYTIASLVVYALPLVLLYLFFVRYRDRLNAIKLFLGTIVTWKILNASLGAYLFGSYGFRLRPFSELGIQELFFERPEKAFPSDHAAVLMVATLLFFYYRYPKLGYLFLVLGVVASSMSRVVVGFHWFGDIVGGWAVGLVGFGLFVWLDRPLTAAIDRLLLALRLKKKVDTVNYNGLAN